MELKDYCSNVEHELTAWKAKLYDMSRKIDRLPGSAKEKMLGNIEDLHILVAEMEDRVNQLRTECPTEWSPIKKEIDDAHVDMRGKYDQTLDSIGKAAPYSVPG